MKLSVIDTGFFKLDGGAMFGVVPKTIWNRLNPADEKNLCTWTMRSLLIEYDDRKILIDTGLGNKQSDKFFSFFYPTDPSQIFSSIKNCRLSVEDITDVFITHFHFDHVGGALWKNEAGDILPSFPNAKYWTNEAHYNWAYEPNARESSSFLKENFVPLKEMGMLNYIDVEQNVAWADHISIKFMNGHTEAMMLPIIQLENGYNLVYAADLIPSHGHVRLPYVMAYDTRPLVTFEEKEIFYEEALENNYVLFFEHDKDYECATLIRDERGRVGVDQLLSLNEVVSLPSI